MRRFLLFLGLIALAGSFLASTSLLASLPYSRIKEPNAVFAFDVDTEHGRVQAVLFDRAKRVPLDHLDARTDLPLANGGSIDDNDNMQFSAATKKIYARVSNVSEYDGSRINQEIPYASAIVETDFAFTKPKTIFSCDGCSLAQWIVHPTLPKLYVSLADPLPDNADEFQAAKLVEVTLAPTLSTRVIGRIPAHAELRITPDGKSLVVFGLAQNSRQPYGELVAFRLSNRRRTHLTLNFPTKNIFDLGIRPQTSDVSPDAREVAYHMGVLDVRTKKTTELIAETDYELDNFFIGWSRDSSRLLFQLMEGPNGTGDRTEVPLIYDRTLKQQWILPIQDAHLLDWSPAQTAILFDKHGDIGFYDLTSREWVHVADETSSAVAQASWVTLPTKRVPKS